MEDPVKLFGHPMLIRAPEDRLRTLATALGVVSMGIGGMPALMPRLFGRLFGVPVGPEPAGPIIFRAMGLRDLVLNASLISAARHGGNYAPWLLARALSDAGDVVAVLLAALAGARGPRTYGLGLVALVHAAIDVLLWRAARRASARAGDGTPSMDRRRG